MERNTLGNTCACVSVLFFCGVVIYHFGKSPAQKSGRGFFLKEIYDAHRDPVKSDTIFYTLSANRTPLAALKEVRTHTANTNLLLKTYKGTWFYELGEALKNELITGELTHGGLGLG